MLIATILPRKFSFKLNGKPLELSDPDPAWTAEQVLNHYTPHYPILATASVQKPVLKDDAVFIEFSTNIGTKG